MYTALSTYFFSRLFKNHEMAKFIYFLEIQTEAEEHMMSMRSNLTNFEIILILTRKKIGNWKKLITFGKK